MRNFAIILLIFGTFINFIASGEIDCQFYFHPSNGYACKVESLETHYIDRVYGLHQPGRHNQDVKFFSANSRKLQFLAENLHKFFPYLDSISIKSPEFREILKEDLAPFGQNLRMLSLANTKLEDLPADLFDNNPYLGHLYIESNVFKHIDKRMFSAVPRLYFLVVKFPCFASQTRDNRIENAIINLDIRCFVRDFQHNYLDRDLIIRMEGPPPVATDIPSPTRRPTQRPTAYPTYSPKPTFNPPTPPIYPYPPPDTCYDLNAQLKEEKRKLENAQWKFKKDLKAKNDEIAKLRQFVDCQRRCEMDFVSAEVK